MSIHEQQDINIPDDEGQPGIRVQIEKLIRWRNRILEAIDQGCVVTVNRTKINDGGHLGHLLLKLNQIRGVIHSIKSSYTLKKNSKSPKNSKKSKDFFEDLNSVYLIWESP